MERIERTIRIRAPSERIFAFLERPENLQRIWPGALINENVQRLAADRTRFRWSRTLCGVPFAGLGTVARCQPDLRLCYELTGGLFIVMNWRLTPEATGTEVHLELGYAPPVSWKPEIWAERVARERDQDADRLLENLKAEFETLWDGSGLTEEIEHIGVPAP